MNSHFSILGLQFAFKGTEAIDRSDVYYTISHLDHPVSALMQSPFKISKGMSALIGIKKKEVNIILCNLKWFIFYLQISHLLFSDWQNCIEIKILWNKTCIFSQKIQHFIYKVKLWNPAVAILLTLQLESVLWTLSWYVLAWL